MEQQARLPIQWFTEGCLVVLISLIGFDDLVVLEEVVLLTSHGGNCGFQELLQ